MARMNKSDIVDSIAESSSLTKVQVTEVVDGLLEKITGSLKDGDTVSFAGFGIFSVTDRAARTARNPRTGEAIDVPACKAPKFKPGKSLKDSIN